MLFCKKVQKETYDKESLKPIIRASICTGEQVAGFKDIHTGKFTEVMLIRSAEDKKSFMERYDISESEITKEW
ncbi:MAG: aspartate dehydrogenase [Lachnospiraceae bacterium]|nr:aspartate dehydrogenase [Lachnospiraceae bacterium]